MADVKQCDRCGAIYKDKDEGTYSLCSTYYNGHEKQVDLCPHCSKMYWEFRIGRRLEGENWENGKIY